MNTLSLLPWMLIERLLNDLLKRDPSAPTRMARLNGKQVRFDIKELPFELTVAVDSVQVRLSTLADDSVDCWIQTELGVLPELKDTANLTRLIKADKLDIEGDPVYAQQLVALFKELDVDWQAELAAKVGDAPAYWLTQLWQRSRKRFAEFRASQQRWVTGVVIEEKQLLPARLEFEQFSAEVQQLRAQIERLERRMQRGETNA